MDRGVRFHFAQLSIPTALKQPLHLYMQALFATRQTMHRYIIDVFRKVTFTYSTLGNRLLDYRNKIRAMTAVVPKMKW